MIAVDVNLLIYAKMGGMGQHEAARAWLDERLSEVGGVGLPWSSLLGFVRVTTNPRVFERPLSLSEAWSQVEEWLAWDNVFVPDPAHRFVDILAAKLLEADRPEHVPDAHLAALAIEYGLTVQSANRDFARFSGLKWENPLDG